MAQAQRVYKHVTISSTAQTLSDIGYTAAQIARGHTLVVTGVGGDMRYGVAGEVPTASQGHIIKDEITSQLNADVPAFQCIAQSADVSATFELLTYG